MTVVVDRRRPSSTLWTPAGGSLWLDMASSANYTETDSGGFLAQLNDLTGNGRNAVEATNRPTIATASGFTVARFDGVNDQMLINSQFFPSGPVASASYIIAMVAKINNTATYGGITTNPAGSQAGCALVMNGAGRWANICSGSTLFPSVTNTNRAIVVSVVSAGVLTLWTNGVQVGGPVTATGNIVNSTRVKLGTYRDENSAFGAFDLEALSVFVGTASTTIRQNLEGYFAHNRDRDRGLPANHPWKTTPPTS